MTITLYTTSTCPYCQKERTYLAEHGLAATEIILDQTKDQLEAFAKASMGFCGVPFTIVTADDGSTKTVKGFHKEELDTLFGFSQEQKQASSSPSPMEQTDTSQPPQEEESASSMPMGEQPSSDGFGTMPAAGAASA